MPSVGHSRDALLQPDLDDKLKAVGHENRTIDAQRLRGSSVLASPVSRSVFQPQENATAKEEAFNASSDPVISPSMELAAQSLRDTDSWTEQPFALATPMVNSNGKAFNARVELDIPLGQMRHEASQSATLLIVLIVIIAFLRLASLFVRLRQNRAQKGPMTMEGDKISLVHGEPVLKPAADSTDVTNGIESGVIDWAVNSGIDCDECYICCEGEEEAACKDGAAGGGGSSWLGSDGCSQVARHNPLLSGICRCRERYLHIECQRALIENASNAASCLDCPACKTGWTNASYVIGRPHLSTAAVCLLLDTMSIMLGVAVVMYTCWVYRPSFARSGHHNYTAHPPNIEAQRATVALAYYISLTVLSEVILLLQFLAQLALLSSDRKLIVRSREILLRPRPYGLQLPGEEGADTACSAKHMPASPAPPPPPVPSQAEVLEHAQSSPERQASHAGADESQHQQQPTPAHEDLISAGV